MARVTGANHHLFEKVWQYGPTNFVDRLLLLALLSHDATAKDLAAMTGASHLTVWNHMTRLRQDGWVTATRLDRQGHANLYRINPDRLRGDEG